ncbi:hypothetical protein ACIQ6U_19435 [Lysinibacillus fusiformis]
MPSILTTPIPLIGKISLATFSFVSLVSATISEEIWSVVADANVKGAIV